MNVIHRFCLLMIIPAALWCSPIDAQEVFAQDSAMRHFYLDDLLHAHQYAPAKNSFIFQQMKRGDRKTLADIKGSGSIRHIWSTWARSFDPDSGTEPGKVLLRIFVDGESSPSIAGTIDELFKAAEKGGERYAPEPSFNYKGAFNLYLPIYFQRGCRLEIESLDDLAEIYAQIDYRLTPRPESEARLFSRRTSSGLDLRYIGAGAPHFTGQHPSAAGPPLKSKQVESPAGASSSELVLKGPAVLQELTFEGDGLDDLQLSISWDEETTPSVHAPLKYLFGGFDTLALRSRAGTFTCYFPMPFRKVARIKLENPTPRPQLITVRYALNLRADLKKDVYYFHALFREERQAVGYRDFVVLATRGEGHFVGINLFDSGHNHGGGDTALIDADTSTPSVLHGIAGEDYFSFAWHKTGRMHLLAGAPAHERRYRFHFENPYPFRSSLVFTFGVFAGLQPKSVAFWYRKAGPLRTDDWFAPGGTWKVLGPFDESGMIPEKIDDRSYETEVAFAKRERLSIRWEDASMVSGFLDLTHHYRHYLFTTKGTGFVAGVCRIRALTYIYSPAAKQVEALIGHDDAVRVSVNDELSVALEAAEGFHPSFVKLNLRAGWNKLSLLIDNRENITWRWLGFSLSLHGNDGQLRGIKISSNAETS